MNLTDLRDLLHERAATPASHEHHTRMLGIRTKVRERRIRSALATAVVAVLVLSMMGVAAALAAPPAPRLVRPAPAPTRLIEGFPEYESGRRVLAAASAALPTRSVSVRVVPATLDLWILSRCTTTPSGSTGFAEEFSVNGTRLSTSMGNCSGTAASRPDNWSALGVRIGEPVTVTLTVIGSAPDPSRLDPSPSPGPVPDAGSFALAVAAAVPFLEYPFPPRPDRLEPLHPAAGYGTLVHADAAEPNRRIDTTMTWAELAEITIAAQTPGILTILVNGVPLERYTSWDYSVRTQTTLRPSLSGLGVSSGDQVTVSVVPEYLTGGWWVGLRFER